MGAPAHLVLLDNSQQLSSLPSPAGSVFSPDSCASSLSSSDSSSSSFTQSFPPDCDPAPKVYPKEEKQCSPKNRHVLHMSMRRKNRANLKQVKKSTSIEPLGERNNAATSCTTSVSVAKALCRSAGAFAADCAAVCCCPCAVLSLLALILVDLPSALARKMVTRLQTRLCIEHVASAGSSRDGDHSHPVFTPARSHREPSEGEGQKQAVSVIRFDTLNLLKHFEAENVGFGCLSQNRE